MNAPVRTDEITGLKIFNTRAAKATDKITGKGYSAIDDQALKELPPPPPGAKFNAEEQAKYRGLKDWRVWWLLFVGIVLAIYGFFVWLRIQHPW